ncbi:RDD family protein [Mycolicibacterium monacense]|uniref:RDD domain-containing protein n=2 Tax=Mycobacteriaceae TaxID=1762 RepID=A0AAD1IYQ3_MYCMB|nr:RDD family protein [Mycolicibacterium monacense]ORB22487.1 hypothetical protein BST34_07555 [Mycolicibacterium monacense DSM 44395]BBZ62578.1 hypothetical protein MMON_38790 [Mycolicibacterium monacense]
MAGQPGGAALSCPQCGSGLPPHARFCGTCGQTLSGRILVPRPRARAAPVDEPATPPDTVTPAGGGVRCAASLLDLAVMISPAMPLSTAGAVLGVAEVVYVVVPVAFVAVWIWLQIWQGLTGNTFGKAMLGLRLVRAADHRPPGVGATVLRGLAFVATLGLAGLPVLLSPQPAAAWHDRLSGLGVLDVTTGANPLGQPRQRTLRRTPNRGLNRVVSPVPVSGRRG